MSDVISAFTAGQEDFIIGTLGYSWGKTHPENTKNKAEGKEKRQGQRKEKKSRGNSKWSLTFYYQAQSPEPGTHIPKLCRQPKLFNEKVFPCLSVWVFFSSLMLRGVGRKSIPRGRGRGESQRKVHREASGWGFPPLTWPRVHVKSSQENQESACLRKMLSYTSGCENTMVERHLLVMKPPLPKDVGTMTSLILLFCRMHLQSGQNFS